jgi:outer membrane protein assembly factor BamB
MATLRQRRRRTAYVLILAGLTACGTVVPTGSAWASTPPWLQYHGDATGSGVAPSITAVDTAARAWTSPALDGQLYGEPLVTPGGVFVATENDTVYELSPADGSVVWSTHLGSPVPSGDLPCGDITPTVGITGTPVIDQGRGEIFVVADEMVNARPAHLLVGLNTTSGKPEMRRRVDPAGADPAALLQRTGLTLDDGNVVFAMGGNFGDCASYRGRVVSVSEEGGSPTFFTVDAAAGESQGAIWMGGAAPAVDAQGHIWVSVGNGSVDSAAQTYDDSDSALELSPSLQLMQYFAPANWPKNNADDLDMSMAPALLADGQVVLAGKSRIIYLLDGARLGAIGGQQVSLPSGCREDIDGGSAVVGSTVYLPCLTGIIAVQATLSPPALSIQWRSSVGGGPPIVAAGLIWTISQKGQLSGLNPTDGQSVQSAEIGAPANHFATPSVGDGLFLVTNADQVLAFSASAGNTATATPTTTVTSRPSTASSTQPIGRHHSARGSDWLWLPAGLGVVLVAGLTALAIRSRRRTR